MRRALTYEDVLLIPQWSDINSRKDVSLNTYFNGRNYTLPIISANMDSVTGVSMANALHNAGGAGCLHRFCSTQDNINAFIETEGMAWCSFGLGEQELERACALVEVGCKTLVLDVAHGAQQQVAEQYLALKMFLRDKVLIIVGNFGSVNSIVLFEKYINKKGYDLDGIKLGIGNGANCTTRVKTGHGYPQWSLIKDVYEKYDGFIIADGNIKNAGDVAKALGAGADFVMVGSLLAGTDECPGDIYGVTYKADPNSDRGVLADYSSAYKILRGSASAEAYADQGKTQDYIAAEGISAKIPYKGSVVPILKDIEGGLRSALSYSGARTLDEFREKAEFVEITGAGAIEGSPHILNRK